VRVAFVTGSISRESGGLFPIIRNTALQLRARGAKVEVLGTYDRSFESDRRAWEPLTVRVFQKVGPYKLHWAPSLSRYLSAACVGGSMYDIVSIEGIWMGTAKAAWDYCKKYGVPCVVSPQGMLDRWAWQRSFVKKLVLRKWFVERMLRGASCLHLNSEAELVRTRELGLKTAACVVPNGVTLPDHAMGMEPPKSGRKMLLFLGRLHPKKGVLTLARAWAGVARLCPGWQLVIAGPDEGNLVSKIRKLCPPEQTVIPGPAFGRQKADLLRTADALILPSYSEGQPMVVLEAWSYAKPVLMTKECNLPKGFADGAAVEVRHEVNQLGRSILAFCHLTEEERRAMGMRGRSLVERDFSWDRVAEQLAESYKWLLNLGRRPACAQM